MLMADLRECADDMPVEDVRARLSQLSAEFAIAYKAAGVGRKELRQVAAESASGPEGRAAVHRRVAGANSRIAETLCGCAVCARAAVKSKLAQEEQSRDAAVVHVVRRQAAEMGWGAQEKRRHMAQV